MMDDGPGIYRNGKLIGRLVSFSIDNGSGEFAPLTPLPAAATRTIRCVPTLSREGWHYAPDWWGITAFG